MSQDRPTTTGPRPGVYAPTSRKGWVQKVGSETTALLKDLFRGRQGPEQYPYTELAQPPRADRVVIGSCPICFNSCPVKYHLAGDRLTTITGLEKDPVTKGRLCPKGQYQIQMYYSPDRLTRPLKREIISRSYNLLIKSMFLTPFRDAQCGFKALTRKAAQAIVPSVKNNNWFFDTELLIIAARRGYRIKQVPVKWDDDATTTVNLASTAAEDLKGLLRLRFGGIPQVPPPAGTRL